VKAKLRSVAGDLKRWTKFGSPTTSNATSNATLAAEVTSLWQTPQVRDRRPEVTDGALNVQWYIENVLFRGHRRGVRRTRVGARRRVRPDAVDVSTLYEFRSWAGSDRDGNPYVTRKSPKRPWNASARSSCRCTATGSKALSGVLSQDASNIETSGAFDERLEDHKQRLAGVAVEAEERYPDEPYRQRSSG